MQNSSHRRSRRVGVFAVSSVAALSFISAYAVPAIANHVDGEQAVIEQLDALPFTLGDDDAPLVEPDSGDAVTPDAGDLDQTAPEQGSAAPGDASDTAAADGSDDAAPEGEEADEAPIARPGQRNTINEVEPNHTSAQAQQLNPGTRINARFDWPTSHWGADYYRIAVPSTGRLAIDFTWASNLGFGHAVNLSVLNATGDVVFSWDLNAGDFDGSLLRQAPVFVGPGNHFIRVRNGHREFYGEPYTISFAHHPGVNEVERNNTSATANEIQLDQRISGYVDNGFGGDRDYFRLNMPAERNLQVDFRFPCTLGTGHVYTVETFSTTGARLSDWRINGGQCDGSWIRAQGITAPAGNFFVRVSTPVNSRNALTTAYDLTVSVRAEQPTVALAVPAKTGTARVGSTLTAQAGTVEPGTALAFQWLRGAQEIPGATGRTFRLTEAEGGQNVRVRVTASRDHHRATTRTSANLRVTGIIRGGTARVTGNARVGARLTADVSGLTPTGTTNRFQWLRNGQPIAGATARTFVLGNADGGQRISVRVTATRAHHEERVITSGAVTVPGRANQVHLTGTALVGNTLRANTTMITPRPTRFEFQWLRNGQVIRNATAATYRLVPADAGQNISVRVTAIRAGSAPARITSPNTRVQGVIQGGTARITGNQTVGSRLTAQASGFTPTGTTLRFQWLRNGQPIAGATARTYTLVAADAGNRIGVRVTATRAHHNERTVTSQTITAR